MAGRKKPQRSGGGPAADDGELFRKLMSGTRPLKVDVVEPARPKRRAKARFTRRDQADVLRESLEADVENAESQNGDGLLFRHPSVGRRTLRRLARGGFSIQAEADLHGLTTAEARIVLGEFLGDCRQRGFTCVRIVHGKGRRSGHRGPVLKRSVDRWLRQWEGVLAFVSARQIDGGTGALYVLLRKQV
jgi:DNA-nicking Smr family endonuclease